MALETSCFFFLDYSSIMVMETETEWVFFCGHDRDHGSTVILPADDQAECHHFIIYDFDMDHIYMLKSDIIIYKEKRIWWLSQTKNKMILIESEQFFDIV